LKRSSKISKGVIQMGPAVAMEKNKTEQIINMVSKLNATIINEKNGVCVLTDSEEKLEKMIEMFAYYGFDIMDDVKITTVDDWIGGSNIAI
jgi:hypothetical protein